MEHFSHVSISDFKEGDFINSQLEKQLIQKAAAARIPLNASFELLPLCNMNCRMCYIRLSRRELSQKWRLLTADEWLSLASQMQQAGTLFVLLTGGEPLLYPDFREVYLGLRNLGMIPTVNTNGTLLDETWADFFAAYPPRRINITLYGAGRETYQNLCGFADGFEKAQHAIRLLRERQMDVKINGSLVKANQQDLSSLLALADSLDAPINVDTYIYPAARERNTPFSFDVRLSPEEAAVRKLDFCRSSMPPENFHAFLQKTCHDVLPENFPAAESNRMHCQAGKSSCTINWQGQLRPCVMLQEPSIPVLETGFSFGWKQLQQAVDRIILSSECGSCQLRNLCPVCAACARLETGAYDGTPPYLCRYTKELLRLCTLGLSSKETETSFSPEQEGC